VQTSIPPKQIFSERQLRVLAKRFRIKAGISKAEAARQLKVIRATVQQAEEYPDISLTKLRVRMIEKYSPFKVVGPVFLLRKR
jgi:DNA-binding XRE family transcriptional regulator